MCISTNSTTWRTLDRNERERLSNALRDRELNLTTQREAVLETIASCSGHICAEHILAAVESHRPNSKMNKTTVYRTLDLLVELGLVSEHKCGDGPAQYELASHGAHSHLLCRRCGILYDLDSSLAADLREKIRAQHGFSVEIEDYPIWGVCSTCGR